MTIAVCPGSFDPVTNGHIDVITRCCRLFDEVHVVVAVNAMKKPLFTETERVDIIKHALADSRMDRRPDHRLLPQGRLPRHCEGAAPERRL